MPETLLILGGTTEATKLARMAHEKLSGRARIVVSLAGRTRAPAKNSLVETRSGGFGGAWGLADYLRAEKIALVVDATHPFAARISANARVACAEANVPRLQLVRPPWTIPKLARVTWAANLGEAAMLLPDMSRAAFLAVGGRGMAAFETIETVRLVARAIEMPDEKPANIEVVLGRPPFTVEAERDLLERLKVDTLVARASGGVSGFAKVEAARDLKLSILLVRRPEPEPGETVDNVEDALKWIETRI